MCPSLISQEIKDFIKDFIDGWNNLMSYQYVLTENSQKTLCKVNNLRHKIYLHFSLLLNIWFGQVIFYQIMTEFHLCDTQHQDTHRQLCQESDSIKNMYVQMHVLFCGNVHLNYEHNPHGSNFNVLQDHFPLRRKSQHVHRMAHQPKE